MSSIEPAVEALKNKKRTICEEKILRVIDTLDPSLTNGNLYREKFKSWSDTEFDSFMSGMRVRQNKLVLYIPNLKLNLKLDNIFKAAKDLNLELFEQLRLWDSTTKRYYTTPQKYPVITVPIRRLKQFLMSKISVPDSDTKLDNLTGQVVKPDKGSAISSVEMQTILSKGLRTSISELIRIRGGDINAYSNFRNQLEETGNVSLNDLPDDSRARSSVIMKTYLLGMHIDSNL